MRVAAGLGGGSVAALVHAQEMFQLLENLVLWPLGQGGEMFLL